MQPLLMAQKEEVSLFDRSFIQRCNSAGGNLLNRISEKIELEVI